MTTPTGIELIDRELERRGPFSSTEEAEALAAELLAVWRALAPYSDGLDAASDQRQQAHRE